MDLKSRLFQPLNLRVNTVVMGIFENFENIKDSDLPYGFEKQLEIIRNPERKDFQGKLNETMVLYSALGEQKNYPFRLILVGFGKKKDFTINKLRKTAGTVGSMCFEKKFDSLGFVLPDKRSSGLTKKDDLFNSAAALIEGVLLGSYRFNHYKENKDKLEFEFEELSIFYRSKGDSGQVRKAIAYATYSVEATTIARDLANTPSNHMTPEIMAQRSRKLAKKYGLSCQVISGNALEKNKLNGILAVGKGSKNTPRLIILEHKPARNVRKDAKPIVLIGKGVTFDSGGISLKPGLNMDRMKTDMSGGAAVIAAMAALGALKVPVRAIGLVPAVENMPGGSAQKPGDVIEYLNGKSVEVLNTDAEGRLILADALAYAERYEPLAVVDIATLTGACVVALGQNAAGIMGNSEKLMAELEKTAGRTGESVWKLPLWPPYREQIKGDITDIKNIGTREGGAINAGGFLQEFADKYQWAHIDIAGMAWTDKPRGYEPRGATGFGSRLLLNLVKAVGEKKLKFE